MEPDNMETESEEIVDEAALRRINAQHLCKIGNMLENVCPPASRLYISNLERRVAEFPDLLKMKSKHCSHCGSIWNASNFKVRTQPPQRLNRHLRKLLKIERNESWKLNTRQKKKLKQFYNSTSKIVYRCLTCQKTTSFPGSKSNGSSLFTKTNTTSTPVPKLKLNKSDLNAGLFIPSPIQKSNLNNSEVSSNNSSKMSENSFTFNDSLNTSKNMKANTSDSSKHGISFPSLKVSSELSAKEQSSLKRKKTLLAQILDQEQEKSKKKKPSLSSFLVSL